MIPDDSRGQCSVASDVEKGSTAKFMGEDRARGVL